MRKINIGAGHFWKSEGWESLDNAPTSYSKKWKHYGKCWDSNLQSNSYHLVFTSHTLEHIPQFRIEKTISEINRIMKIDGTLRILVPDLEASARAYIKKDKNFFKFSQHYDESLGITGSFLRQIISPGGQTIAINREFDEILGGYAHLFSFDFEIMKILLEKWGFYKIRKCSPGKSKLKELREFQHFVIDGKKYDISDAYLKKKEAIRTNEFYTSGFDKRWNGQLVVEAKKKINVKYSDKCQFLQLQQSRYNSRIDKLKIKIFFYISNFIERLFKIYQLIKKPLTK
tara:strand:- start:1542 stop:2399 length:858 start_codon:yes stop_codon:yes gene_type:complete